jgi:solute carrier family 25 citrate transporter 1
LGAGITEAILVMTPAETLKVKLIHDRFQPEPKYHGLIHGVSTIIKQSGFGGIYKGLLPTILKQGSNQGVRFLVYEDTKKFLNTNVAAFPEVVNMLISGGLAGAASVFGNLLVIHRGGLKFFFKRILLWMS